MRVRVIVPFTILFLCLTSLYAIAGDIEDGFRGIAWGTPLSDIKHLNMKKAPGNSIPTYIATNDDLRLGSIPLKRILYRFSSNARFIGVDLIFSSADTDAVYGQISILLGDPSSTDATPESNTAIWNSPMLKTVLTSNATRGALSIRSKSVDRNGQNDDSFF
ncbi:hypothetical protein [Desulfovibrio inopinatus]|uniref:hypothetical protein n=1 Tax=Desulfovibrio inopinatus TaxID=102109 RepID=UPI00047FCF7F|nr:hypothetical protein [Desulfovibrio inopinatus]